MYHELKIVYRPAFVYSNIITHALLYTYLYCVCSCVRNLAKATVILLPILGCTWIIGIIAVNENLIVFAWIFTILNSLQVHNVLYVCTC